MQWKTENGNLLSGNDRKDRRKRKKRKTSQKLFIIVYSLGCYEMVIHFCVKLYLMTVVCAYVFVLYFVNFSYKMARVCMCVCACDTEHMTLIFVKKNFTQHAFCAFPFLTLPFSHKGFSIFFHCILKTLSSFMAT